MRKIVGLVVIALVGLMTACGPVCSLSPLYTKDDVVFDPSLLGDWTQVGADDFTLRFENDGSSGYKVTDTEFARNGSPSKQTTFEAHLVALNGFRFLDVVPDQIPAQPASYAVALEDQQSGQGQGTHLLRLGDGFYAEVARGSAASGNGISLNLKQAHWIFRVQSKGNTLRLSNMDQDWLKKAINQGKLSIASTVTSDDSKDLVITADVKDLQGFVVAHGDDDQVFQQTAELRRVK